MAELQADVLVAGGGLGGVAAALAAARRGRSVVLAEDGDWLGGQLTAQAVPPDEHPWIERCGCTRSYRLLRQGIREHYRRWYPLTASARARAYLNPGGGYVSHLCHEPRASRAVIEDMLAPHAAGGLLRVLRRHRAVAVDGEGDQVRAVTLVAGGGGPQVTVVAAYVLDATESGDLLALSGTEYRTGSEAQAETGEPHAGARARPLNMQAVTLCFAVDHLEGQDHTVQRPATYGFWRAYRPPRWPGPLLDWTAPDPRTLEPVARTLVPNPTGDPAAIVPGAPGGDRDLWLFRRIAARGNFRPGAYPSDITLVNWPMTDYVGGPLYEVPAAEAARHLSAARQLSLSVLYWLQTEAPRPDGGTGYPGLRLRRDVVGTPDGLARPYVRESRRIVAETTVVEQDLSVALRGDRGAVSYPDAVGVGSYRIDLHPTTGGDGYVDLAAHPFEIPLGALVPVRVDNLLPAAKNIGTTHVTNGCYRLHPVEWNVGEVAGLLAAYCLQRRAVPRQVRADPRHLAAFQRLLDREGVQRRWPGSPAD